MKPKYNVCMKCLLKGKIRVFNVSEDREKHMEAQHGLTGRDLKEMILKPRIYFASTQEIIDALADFVKDSIDSEGRRLE